MTQDMFRLEDRVALVTGATTGLGQAMALALAGAGADVVSLGRRSDQETGAGVTDLGRQFAHIQCDLLTASVADLQNRAAFWFRPVPPPRVVWPV